MSAPSTPTASVKPSLYFREREIEIVHSRSPLGLNIQYADDLELEQLLTSVGVEFCELCSRLGDDFGEFQWYSRELNRVVDIPLRCRLGPRDRRYSTPFSVSSSQSSRFKGNTTSEFQRKFALSALFSPPFLAVGRAVHIPCSELYPFPLAVGLDCRH